MTHLLCFGLGFSARVLAARLASAGWTITATSRSAGGAAAIRRAGYRGLVFDGAKPLLPDAYEGVTHVLSSAPPDDDGDPVLRHEAGAMAARVRDLAWVGYLSTTGVYGDHGGGWVDENTPLTPNTTRGERRVTAERQWLALQTQHGLPVHIFRRRHRLRRRSGRRAVRRDARSCGSDRRFGVRDAAHQRLSCQIGESLSPPWC